jgi:apolipoprotein D and lipocalin family protein
MSRLARAVPLVVVLTAATAAWALPGHPTRPIVAQTPADADRILGRWYEILRTPNTLQKNCFGAYQVWTRKRGGFSVQQVCHRDSPTGKVAQVTASAKPLNGDNTLFDTSIFGGLIHRKYMLADHAPDYSWLIATTADGRYPKLLFRSPSMPSSEEAALRQRMARIGFDMTRLEDCGEQPG